MSDYEHIKGTLKPTGKTVEEFVGDAKLESWHSDKQEYFDDECYRKAVEIDGLVYEVESKELDPYDGIFNASHNNDGTIAFELRYYNGGCDFSEALDEALKKL
jgi:hypothetical protein